MVGVVQDMLAAHREDNDRRQQVQLQMMLAHREETELRLLEARDSADKQMRLLREMHEMAARCCELKTEKSVRREVEEHPANLAWVNSGRAERGCQRSVVQRELERQRSGLTARVGFAESPLSSRASTPSPAQEFVYCSERDSKTAAADDGVVSCTHPSVINLTAVEQSEGPNHGRPSNEPESIHPVQLSMVQTGADNVTVASTSKVTVSDVNAMSTATTAAGNFSSVPPGYMLMPIAPSYPTPVGVGVGSCVAPGPTPGPALPQSQGPSLQTSVGIGVGPTKTVSASVQNTALIGDCSAASASVCLAILLLFEMQCLLVIVLSPWRLLVLQNLL